MTVKCPHCKNEIDSLWLFGKAEIRYQFTVDGIERVEDYPVEGHDQYECPDCCEVLIDEEDCICANKDAREVAMQFLETGIINL